MRFSFWLVRRLVLLARVILGEQDVEKMSQYRECLVLGGIRDGKRTKEVSGPFEDGREILRGKLPAGGFERGEARPLQTNPGTKSSAGGFLKPNGPVDSRRQPRLVGPNFP